jgi:hypothetical protein
MSVLLLTYRSREDREPAIGRAVQLLTLGAGVSL